MRTQPGTLNGHHPNGGGGKAPLQAGLTGVDFWADCLSVKQPQTDRLGCVRQCWYANEKTDTLIVGRENGQERQPRA